MQQLRPVPMHQEVIAPRRVLIPVVAVEEPVPAAVQAEVAAEVAAGVLAVEGEDNKYYEKIST